MPRSVVVRINRPKPCFSVIAALRRLTAPMVVLIGYLSWWAVEQPALSVAGVTVPTVTAYPDEVKFTLKLQQLVGQPVLTEGYFGNPDTVIAKVEELKGTGTWATIKTHAEAKDEAKFNAAIGAKKK